jgi:hypothetical protein
VDRCSWRDRFDSLMLSQGHAAQHHFALNAVLKAYREVGPALGGDLRGASGGLCHHVATGARCDTLPCV